MRYNDDEFEKDEFLSNDKEIAARETRILIISGIVMLSLPAVMIARMIFGYIGTSVFGAFIAAAGLVAYKDKYKKYFDQRLGAFLWIMLGAFLIFMPIAFSWLRSMGFERPSDEIRIEKIIVGAFLALFGTAVIAMPFISCKMEKKRCWLPVTAECINMAKIHYKRTGGVNIIPLWKYIVSGKTILKINDIYTGGRPVDIGDKKDILVNPDAPEEIYHDNSIMCIFWGFWGLCIAALGIYLLIHANGS